LFVKDRTDAIADFYEKSQALSISDVKRQGKYAFLKSTLFHNMLPLCAGGFLTGLGVCVMHYIGMVAMKFNGNIVWNEGVVAASVLIALFASTAAYWILFRLLVVFPSVEMLRIASAFIAMIAVNGMHYTGMAAASFVFENVDATSVDTYKNDGNLVPQKEATYGAIIAGICLSFFALALALNDMRAWYYSVAQVMRELDMRADPPVATAEAVADAQSNKHSHSTQHSSHSHSIDGESFLQLYRTLRCKTRSGKNSAHTNKAIIQARLDAKRQSLNSESSPPPSEFQVQESARNQTTSQHTQTSPARKWTVFSPNKQSQAVLGQQVKCVSPLADRSKSSPARTGKYDEIALYNAQTDCHYARSDSMMNSSATASTMIDTHTVSTSMSTSTMFATASPKIHPNERVLGSGYGRYRAIFDDIEDASLPKSRVASEYTSKGESHCDQHDDIGNIENLDQNCGYNYNMQLRVSPLRTPQPQQFQQQQAQQQLQETWRSTSHSSSHHSVTNNSLFCSPSSPSPATSSLCLSLSSPVAAAISGQQQRLSLNLSTPTTAGASALMSQFNNYPARQRYSFSRNAVVPIDFSDVDMV
jgi:hypothetical protein